MKTHKPLRNVAPETTEVGWHPSIVAALLPYALIACVAALLYTPWPAAPFSVLDFSEFLPILADSSSLVGSIADLTSYYAVHGRSALLTYAYIGVNWWLFGPDPGGWEVARFLVMLANSMLLYALLRRAGSSVMTAAVSSALFVTATAAVGAWLRLTGEMLSMLCLLIVAHLGLRYQVTRLWRIQGIAIAALIAAAVLAKETTAVLAPLALLFVCCRDETGKPRIPEPSARNATVVVATVVAVVGIGLLIFSTVRSATDTGYVRAYGSDDRALSRFAASWLHFGFPVSVGDTMSVLFAKITFLTTVVAGWILRLRNVWPRVRVLAEAGFLAAFVVLGMAAYMPWPRIEAFYLYPFLLGPILLLAAALQHLQAAHGSGPVGVLGVLLLLLSLAPAYNSAQEDRSLRRLNAEIVGRIATLPKADTLVVAVRGLAEQRWAGTGPTLRRYALATGVRAPLPPATEMTCAAVGARMAAGSWQASILTYEHLCGALFEPSFSVRSTFNRLLPSRLRAITLEHRADFLVIGDEAGKDAP